jgi:hypothetical protein
LKKQSENLAWGIIDAIMYLMNSLAERSRGLDALRAMRAAKDPDEAQRMLAAELPEQFAAVLFPGELEPVLRRLRALPEPSAGPQLTGDDWLGAFGIFGPVFFSTLTYLVSGFTHSAASFGGNPTAEHVLEASYAIYLTKQLHDPTGHTVRHPTKRHRRRKEFPRVLESSKLRSMNQVFSSGFFLREVVG